jgi:hypothetical protein
MNIGKHKKFISTNKIENIRDEQWETLYAKIIITTWVIVDDITRVPVNEKIFRLAWNLLRETRTHLCTYNIKHKTQIHNI